ncbi:hypothetical protein ES319_D05G307300v1 [Gossypium barbadense]|uniref:Uncharacterized protein n=1 Tax=Gossypium barbadense TaxID=3634 RepID=A0A5J5RKV5_GOSBA|nr:hypothetical protein ES319_D05G307300v1 [Gossypium barbadense]
MINFFENTVMAMQTGVGLSKILILAGAGYTGTVLLKNGKLSDILGELQSLVKGLEKSGEQADDSDALLAQATGISTADNCSEWGFWWKSMYSNTPGQKDQNHLEFMSHMLE